MTEYYVNVNIGCVSILVNTDEMGFDAVRERARIYPVEKKTCRFVKCDEERYYAYVNEGDVVVEELMAVKRLLK